MPINTEQYKNQGLSGQDRKAIVEANLKRLDYAEGNGLLSKAKKELLPGKQILIYPAVNSCYTEKSPYKSVKTNGTGYLLTSVKMEDYVILYQRTEEDRKNPYFAPVLAENLQGLPDTLVLTAQYDPLRDEGEDACFRYIRTELLGKKA